MSHTGAGSISRGARAKPNSLGSSLRPSSFDGVVSIAFYPKIAGITVRKCRIIMVPIYSTTNAMFTTIQCKVHVTNRLGKQLKKQSQCGFFLSNVLPQSAKSARARSECARRRELPRCDHFRDSNDVDFTKDIAKSFDDRCESRLTSEMSNAMLSKNSERRK